MHPCFTYLSKAFLNEWQTFLIVSPLAVFFSIFYASPLVIQPFFYLRSVWRSPRSLAVMISTSSKKFTLSLLPVKG
jgi:hypothetical protein